MKEIIVITTTLMIFICFANCEKTKSTSTIAKGGKTPLRGRTTTTTSTAAPIETLLTPPNLTVPPVIHIPPRKNKTFSIIPPKLIQEWATEISENLLIVEKQVVRKEVLLNNFKDIKIETRDGAAIVEKMGAALEDLLEKRARAAEAIGREAERLAKEAGNSTPPKNYVFDSSINLDKRKPIPEEPEEWELPNNCSSLLRIPLKNLTHFGIGAKVDLDISGVKVAFEVFDCDYRVLPNIYWSEQLLNTFKKNYAQDAMTDFQYFCSAKGYLRQYPAASWDSMFKLNLAGDDDEGPADVYDCRLRPWYVAAEGAPRDIVILYDGSGSMDNSLNKIHAEQFILTLLSALTDDDQVNVMYLHNNTVDYVIDCFNDTLVSANHVNADALMTMIKNLDYKNETNITFALQRAAQLLDRQQSRTDRPKPCQQAIVILADSINENYTAKMREFDLSNRIRVFVIWLHDIQGLRDNSYWFSESLACSSDGHFTELVTDSDVTEQVMNILRVLERPLVHQRTRRLRVFSDVYANVEDPRRSHYYWRIKENAEQAFRYRELRKNKRQFLSEERRYKDYMRHLSLDDYGYYYEGQDKDYRLLISVSVPVFDDTRFENITILLPEENPRNATRTYPANRLLGVAGVDIPIEHLKLILPYYQLGAGGSLFIIDHRGNIILHDNIKPVFDGDILRPGYRTVDMLDLEQSSFPHLPRNYHKEWLEFRNAVVIEQTRGKRELSAKNIYDNWMRAVLEKREYHWKRVMDHYTVVVGLPKYNKRHAVPDGAFTQELAQKFVDQVKSDFAVHPDWLYCKHVDAHFTEPPLEVNHFIRRRSEEPDFKMQKLNHHFSPLPPKLLDKTYMCNEELIARLCKEAMATEQWAAEHQDPDAGRDCLGCTLGSVTAFFASESGLTRWQMYHLTSHHADPPAGDEWPRGPSESWYKRAAASPGTLVVHAPVTPRRRLRNSFIKPPALTTREKWFTAARTLGHHEKGMIGVAGFHFFPQHLEDVFSLITNRPCQDGDDDCEEQPHCDGENWACVLIDEGGWIVAGDTRDQNVLTEEDPVREHLARVHPLAMKKLLTAKIFELHWIHDYQAICFPPEHEHIKKSASRMIPTVLKSLWRSAGVFFHVTRHLISAITLLAVGHLVAGDTEAEKEKHRRRIWRDWQREKYDRLYDPAVTLNRTRFAACDRMRALYVLRLNAKTQALLLQPPKNCSWPVVGAVVPQTNLLLLAVNKLCPVGDAPLPPDPLINTPVDMRGKRWEYMSSAARLACWRNKTPLPIRAPNTTCYPHNYTDEEGYRQCGPWQPNEPEAEALTDDAANFTLNYLLMVLLIALC